MFVGMGGWFLYDGYVGYARYNKSKLLEKFPPEIREKSASIPVYPTANTDRINAIKDKINSAPIQERARILVDAIGGKPSIETDKAAYYFGQDSLIKIGKDADRLTSEIEITPAEKSVTDFRFQKVLGFVVGGLGFFMLMFFIFRVVKARAVVSDQGLSINGRKPIPFDAMKSLDTSNFRKKGRVYILCEGNGSSRVLFDEYHYAEFDKLMAALCEKTGFEDPVAAERAEKSQRATGTSAANAGQ